MEDDQLPRLRAICLALPEAGERPSGRHAAFLVRGRTFAYFLNDHHGDGRLALHCKIPPEGRDLLLGSDPARFFVPPYLGHRGWVGVYLDVPTDWEEVADLVADSYRLIAPKRLAALLDRPIAPR
jgi:predicted DNA-binding protein (MmcQ/YjbR family)